MTQTRRRRLRVDRFAFDYPPRPMSELEEAGSPAIGRIQLAARTGMWSAPLLSLMAVLGATQWLLDRSALAGAEGAYRVSVEVGAGRLILTSGVLCALGGLVVAALTRTIPAWHGDAMRLISSWNATLAIGFVTGGLIGLATGALVVSQAEESIGSEGLVLVPVAAGLIWVIAGWAFAGLLIGVLVQGLGAPEGAATAESVEVKRRLIAAAAIPLRSLLLALLIVVPMAWTFLEQPKWAPLVGVFVAAAIVAFSAIAASRPQLALTKGEVFVAILGVFAVVIMIVAVLNTQGGGHEEPDGHAVARVSAF